MQVLKALHCPKCDKVALLRPSSANPEGEPALCSSYQDRFACHRCGLLLRVTLREWHALPWLSFDDVIQLAREFRAPEVEERLTRDWKGAGLTQSQARDMVEIGMLTEADVSLPGAESAPQATESAEVALVEYNGTAGSGESEPGAGP